MSSESEREREEVHWFGAHLLHPTLRIKPFVLFLFRCPLGTVLFMRLASRCHTEGEGQIRSLRWVSKIDGVRADGCCKIGGERVDGFSHKIVGKNDVEKIEV